MAKGFDAVYNFRYAEEREAFWSDVQERYEALIEEIGPIKAKSLRALFDYGGFTAKDRLEQEEAIRNKGMNAARGMRTFGDFEALERFLHSRAEGGSGISWGNKGMLQRDMRFRLVRYIRQQGRILREEVEWKAQIVSKQFPVQLRERIDELSILRDTATSKKEKEFYKNQLDEYERQLKSWDDVSPSIIPDRWKDLM